MARLSKTTKTKSNKQLNWKEFREKSAASTFVFQGISAGKVPRMRLKDEIFTEKRGADIVKPEGPLVTKPQARRK